MGFKAVHLKQTEKAFKKFAENVVARAKWNLANRKGKPGKNSVEVHLIQSLKNYLTV